MQHWDCDGDLSTSELVRKRSMASARFFDYLGTVREYTFITLFEPSSCCEGCYVTGINTGYSQHPAQFPVCSDLANRRNSYGAGKERAQVFFL